MIAIVKDLGAVRQEVFTDRDDLSKWRNQVTLDLQMFYEKYETKLQESGFSQADKQAIQEAISEMVQHI